MLFLASESPRRVTLLKQAGFSFEAEPSGIDETAIGNEPSSLVQSLALQKARAVFSHHPNDVILAADTMVSIDHTILGKPADEQDAKRMLKLLSSRVHQVHTGYCVLHPGGSEMGFSVTDVEFYALSEREIDDYIATGEPFSKAGAYAIQGKGALLVKKINGDFYNVVELPIAPISRILRDLGC